MTAPRLPTVARWLDRAVNAAIALALATVLLFSGYGLWSDWAVAHAPDDASARLAAVKGPAGPSFRELLAVNPDVVGWLEMEGTGIDHPVVQGEDDSEYLSRDVFGDYSMAGSLFLAKGCSPGFDDGYSMVMGHHMAAGEMFGDLDLYRDGSFLEAHHTGTLWLPDRTLDLEVVETAEADAYDRSVFGVPLPDGGADGALASLGEGILASRGTVGADDDLVLLSTCTGTSASGRTVVVCRVADVRGPGDSG